MFVKECMKNKGRDFNLEDQRRRSHMLEGSSMKNGLKHAFYNSEGVYTGRWKDDEKTGFGVYVSSNGETQYKGQWSKNKFEGYGELSTKNENGQYQIKYDGHFKNGRFAKIGRLFLKNGSYYEGEFERGEMHGQGKMWYSDGSYYVGSWENGRREGEGVFVSPNGNRYEGNWHEGKKHGRGVKIYMNKGQRQVGVWKSDACLMSTIEDMSYKQTVDQPVECPIPKLLLKDADRLLEEWGEGLMSTISSGNSQRQATSSDKLRDNKIIT